MLSATQKELHMTPPSGIHSLERGLRLVTTLTELGETFTISEIAAHMEIARSAARRFVLTLEYMGYLELVEGRYRCRAKITGLGEVFLQSSELVQIAHPHLLKLRDEINETVSLTVLQDNMVTYLDRVAPERLLAVNIVVGSRVPAYATATGRVLLGQLPEEALDAYLASSRRAFTESTATSTEFLKTAVMDAHARGWYMAEQQLRSGIISLAAPVRNPKGGTVAAVNVSSSAARCTAQQIIDEFLGPLLACVEAISGSYLPQYS